VIISGWSLVDDVDALLRRRLGNTGSLQSPRCTGWTPGPGIPGAVCRVRRRRLCLAMCVRLIMFTVRPTRRRM